MRARVLWVEVWPLLEVNGDPDFIDDEDDESDSVFDVPDALYERWQAAESEMIRAGYAIADHIGLSRPTGGGKRSRRRRVGSDLRESSG